MYVVAVTLTLILLIDLNVTSGNNYSCVATGYPDVQLLMWQSGSGDPIQHSHYNTTSEENDFSASVTSILYVNDITCTEAMGYICVFRNGGSRILTESLHVHCNPGKSGLHFTKMITLVSIPEYTTPSVCYGFYRRA